MIRDLEKMALLAQDPARSHFVNVYSPSGSRLATRAKPENLKDFLNDIMRQFGLQYVVVQLRQPNGTSTKKIGEAGYPAGSPALIHEKAASDDRGTFGRYGSPAGDDRGAFGRYGSPAPYGGERAPHGGNFPPYPPYPTAGLQGPFDRQAIVKVELFDEVKNERDFYKQKYEETKEQLQKLERKLEFLELKQKIDEDNKGNEILTEIVSAVAERFANKPPQPAGLQGPQVQAETDSPQLREVMQMLREIGPEYHPEFVALIRSMITKPEFLKDIREVEARHGLIKPKNQTDEPGEN